MSVFKIEYQFISQEGGEAKFPLEFDAERMLPINQPSERLPAWTDLGVEKCVHCPLSLDEHKSCPAAVSLVNVIAWCAYMSSFTEIELKVITEERTTISKTTAQRGLMSLLGLLLASSGCPETAFLRPMARFHLPMATEIETSYRVVSMYLLAQFFVGKSGKQPDHLLTELRTHYQSLRKVNQGLGARLRQAAPNDSSANAVILLDCFASAMPYLIEDDLEDLSEIFSGYTA